MAAVVPQYDSIAGMAAPQSSLGYDSQPGAAANAPASAAVKYARTLKREHLSLTEEGFTIPTEVS